MASSSMIYSEADRQRIYQACSSDMVPQGVELPKHVTTFTELADWLEQDVGFNPVTDGHRYATCKHRLSLAVNYGLAVGTTLDEITGGSVTDVEELPEGIMSRQQLRTWLRSTLRLSPGSDAYKRLQARFADDLPASTMVREPQFYEDDDDEA